MLKKKNIKDVIKKNNYCGAPLETLVCPVCRRPGCHPEFATARDDVNGWQIDMEGHCGSRWSIVVIEEDGYSGIYVEVEKKCDY